MSLCILQFDMDFLRKAYENQIYMISLWQVLNVLSKRYEITISTLL